MIKTENALFSHCYIDFNLHESSMKKVSCGSVFILLLLGDDAGRSCVSVMHHDKFLPIISQPAL